MIAKFGNSENPWTKEKIDEFLEKAERGDIEYNNGRITAIENKDSDGNIERYEKDSDGVWSEK